MQEPVKIITNCKDGCDDDDWEEEEDDDDGFIFQNFSMFVDNDNNDNLAMQ